MNLVWAKTSIACSLALDMEQPDNKNILLVYLTSFSIVKWGTS